MKHLNLSNSKTSLCRIASQVSVAALLVTICIAGFAQSPETKTGTDPTQRPVITQDKDAAVSHIVSGIVKDGNGDPLPGVSIYLRGTTHGTTTDAEGRFEFPRRLEMGDRLTFSFVGLESVEYITQKDSDEFLAIVMNDNAEIMGEVAGNEIYSTKSGFRRLLSNLKRDL